jgi:hypothetical protein
MIMPILGLIHRLTAADIAQIIPATNWPIKPPMYAFRIYLCASVMSMVSLLYFRVKIAYYRLFELIFLQQVP